MVLRLRRAQSVPERQYLADPGPVPEPQRVEAST
jgi:hypothetical protein